MSASTSKKNRASELAAGPSKKQLAAEREASEKKKSNRNRVIIAAVVAVLVAVVLVFNSGVLSRSTTAVSAGSTNYSPAEVQYYYANQYYTFAQQYGSYASMFGLNTSMGVSGLGAQTCPMIENGSWADYFLEAAVGQIGQQQALLDYAKENNITLDETDKAAVEEELSYLSQAAELNKVSVKQFIKSYFGGDVTEQIVRKCIENNTLASKAYDALVASYNYSDEELAAYYDSLNGAQDVYSYALYNVSADSADAAKEIADRILAAYGTADTFKSTSGMSDAQKVMHVAENYSALKNKLDAAVDTVVPGEASTAGRENGASLSLDYADWMKAAQVGDITAVQVGESWAVVLLTDVNDNRYSTVNVRHILVKAVADENGEYSDEALDEAYAKAEALLTEWKSGAATEDSFAELATANSEDAGSAANGGLYESVTKGSMVPAFNAFCYSNNHKPGDTAVVYGNNGSYAGFHVMYFVGQNEGLYSNQIANADLVNTAVSEWLESSVTALNVKTGFFAKLVG